MSVGNKQMNNQVIPKSQEKSNLEILKEKANAEGATEVDILRSALADSQERYNDQADNIAKKLDEYDKRVQKLEQAVEQSNKQKTVDVSKALEDAADKIFQPMKEKSEDLLKTIKQAEDRAKNIGNSGVNFRKMATYGFFTALFFLLGSGLIQYHFAPSVDYAKRLWWNLEYGRTNPNVEIKFFESEESAEKKYKNQLDYEKEQDFFNTVGNKK